MGGVESYLEKGKAMSDTHKATFTTFGTVCRFRSGSTLVTGQSYQLRDWARRGWPYSELASLESSFLSVTFDAAGDLVDISADNDLPSDELNAWTSECLIRAGYPNHPAIRAEV